MTVYFILYERCLHVIQRSGANRYRIRFKKLMIDNFVITSGLVILFVAINIFALKISIFLFGT